MTSIDNLNHNKKNFLLSHSVEITHHHSLMSMLEERTLSHLNEYYLFSKLSSQLTSQAHSESQGLYWIHILCINWEVTTSKKVEFHQP